MKESDPVAMASEASMSCDGRAEVEAVMEEERERMNSRSTRKFMIFREFHRSKFWNICVARDGFADLFICLRICLLCL